MLKNWLCTNSLFPCMKHFISPLLPGGRLSSNTESFNLVLSSVMWDILKDCLVDSREKRRRLFTLIQVSISWYIFNMAVGFVSTFFSLIRMTNFVDWYAHAPFLGLRTVRRHSTVIIYHSCETETSYFFRFGDAVII
jgi:hypothetical protein